MFEDSLAGGLLRGRLRMMEMLRMEDKHDGV